MLVATPFIRIPLSEIEITYARSSGPGGQNVNKVNSKAVLRWNLVETPSIAPDIKARVVANLRSRLTLAGEIVVASDRYRDQPRNREDCLDKLREMLLQASFVPKKRKKTKPTKSTQRKNEQSKRRHSDKKRARQGRYE